MPLTSTQGEMLGSHPPQIASLLNGLLNGPWWHAATHRATPLCIRTILQTAGSEDRCGAPGSGWARGLESPLRPSRVETKGTAHGRPAPGEVHHSMEFSFDASGVKAQVIDLSFFGSSDDHPMTLEDACLHPFV